MDADIVSDSDPSQTCFCAAPSGEVSLSLRVAGAGCLQAPKGATVAQVRDTPATPARRRVGGGVLPRCSLSSAPCHVTRSSMTPTNIQGSAETPDDLQTGRVDKKRACWG